MTLHKKNLLKYVNLWQRITNMTIPQKPKPWGRKKKRKKNNDS